VGSASSRKGRIGRTWRFIRAAHERGLRVDVWTIDTEADMRRLPDYGVNSIMTDRLDVLAKLLETGHRATD